MCWRDLWAVPPLQCVYVCVCVSASVWCGICGVTLYHSLFAWPVLCPRVNQSWCRHLRRLRGKLIFKNCALKCHINYVTYLRAKPPPPEVGPAYRVCDRWEREREMKRRGAQRVPSTGQTASEEKNIMENGNFAIEQFYNCQGNAKTAEDTLDGKCFRGKLCTPSGWRVAGVSKWNEERRKANCEILLHN